MNWVYSDRVIEHFEYPRNMGSLDERDPQVGTGWVGAPATGGVIRLQIRVSAAGVIEAARFKAQGCPALIACASLASEWVKGKTLERAEAIDDSQIAADLALAPEKVHCAVLAEQAVKAAVADYRARWASGEGPAAT